MGHCLHLRETFGLMFEFPFRILLQVVFRKFQWRSLSLTTSILKKPMEFNRNLHYILKRFICFPSELPSLSTGLSNLGVAKAQRPHLLDIFKESFLLVFPTFEEVVKLINTSSTRKSSMEVPEKLLHSWFNTLRKSIKRESDCNLTILDWQKHGSGWITIGQTRKKNGSFVETVTCRKARVIYLS